MKSQILFNELKGFIVPFAPESAVTNSARPGALGWLLIALRGTAFIIITMLGLGLHLLVRGLEMLVPGKRPLLTPFIAQGVCWLTFAAIGFHWRVVGRPDRQASALVANHVSWIDVLAINSNDRVCFVAKGEVAGWALIGWLARATGTVFVSRNRTRVFAHMKRVAQRIAQGRKIAFFPEPALSDGARVLPFRTSLFGAVVQAGGVSVQPVTLVYHAPAGEGADYYSWGGKLPFLPNLLKVLATPKQGRIDVVFHDSLPVTADVERKVLAHACEERVRSGLQGAGSPSL